MLLAMLGKDFGKIDYAKYQVGPASILYIFCSVSMIHASIGKPSQFNERVGDLAKIGKSWFFLNIRLGRSFMPPAFRFQTEKRTCSMRVH